jgi:putative GTP pyrophosphokinase
MERKGIPVKLENIVEITDIAGVRVICNYIDDVYEVAELLLRQDDIRLMRRSDYIKDPKPSGYRSIHMILLVPVGADEDIRVEVQLRTVGMNYWAKLDHQLSYKAEENEEMDKIRRDL